VPILLHDGCLALDFCAENPVRLEVYVDDTHHAEGIAYFDDGETLAYQTKPSASVSVTYTFDGSTLNSIDNYGTAQEYAWGPDQVLTQIVVYGLGSAPADVLVYDVEVPYMYNELTDALIVDGFSVGLVRNVERIMELAWN